jgi:hypothetical protein
MAFAIHPAQLGFLEAIARGDKIVWHPLLRWLTCFAPGFDGHRIEYTHDWVFPGMHEIIYPLREGRAGSVAGVKLCELQGLLTQTDLLATLDAQASLSPLEVFEHGIAWMSGNSERYRTMDVQHRAATEAKNQIARRFLQTYPLRIPQEIWEQALPKQSS